MDREQVYKEIQETLGLIPTFFKVIPDSTLGMEWHLMKVCRWNLEQSLINIENSLASPWQQLPGVSIAHSFIRKWPN